MDDLATCVDFIAWSSNLTVISASLCLAWMSNTIFYQNCFCAYIVSFTCQRICFELQPNEAHVFHSMPSVADKFNVNSIVLIVAIISHKWFNFQSTQTTWIENAFHKRKRVFRSFYPLVNYRVDHCNEISG